MCTSLSLSLFFRTVYLPIETKVTWAITLPLNLPCEPCFLLFIFRPSFEYEIHSEGCADPGKAPNTCGISTIKVNGVNYSEQKRGINLVAIDGKTGTSFFILMYEIIDIYNISSF